MTQLRPIGWLLVIGFLVIGCQSKPTKPEAELQLLGHWLTGMFDSSSQAQTDGSFFNIRLVAATIWREREDGIWIYLEQASSENTNKPYRQRVYHIYEPERGQYVSDVYTLPDPDTAIGSWRHPDMLDEFGPGDLRIRAGCSVYLQRQSPLEFVGGTRGNSCASNLDEASYATSVVLVTATGINSWDRGFNAIGEQVWGALTGPYEFRRQEQ